MESHLRTELWWWMHYTDGRVEAESPRRDSYTFGPGSAVHYFPLLSESVSRRSGHHAVDGKDGVFCAGQNALAESFVSTLKAELLVSRMKFPSRQAAKTAIFDYLEAFYNTRRLHSALSYRSPADFEEGRMGEANIA